MGGREYLGCLLGLAALCLIAGAPFAAVAGIVFWKLAGGIIVLLALALGLAAILGGSAAVSALFDRLRRR